jgi:hypothetical protein
MYTITHSLTSLTQARLEALTGDELPPFFIPSNSVHRVADGNTSAISAQISDIGAATHAAKQNRFKPPVPLTDWGVQYLRGQRDTSLRAPPVQARAVISCVCARAHDVF